MASAGSVFTCGHLSPLVLPNTLANEAGLLSLPQTVVVALSLLFHSLSALFP